MKHIQGLILILLSVSFSFLSYADQAAYIQKSDAIKAQALLMNHSEIMHLCVPCGDTEPQLAWIEGLDIVDVQYQGFWELQINGVGVDLAYLYYKEGEHWKNVAMKLDIEVSDVPETIEN